MIGGGRVRRRSVGSFVESSPLFFRVGRRKTAPVRRKHNLVTSQEGLVESPDLTRRIENSPRGLGEERMVSAQQGLLYRDSLEEHCLSADGVDTSCESNGVRFPLQPFHQICRHDRTRFHPPNPGIAFEVGYALLKQFGNRHTLFVIVWRNVLSGQRLDL
jgi:hypothetical protein